MKETVRVGGAKVNNMMTPEVNVNVVYPTMRPCSLTPIV